MFRSDTLVRSTLISGLLFAAACGQVAKASTQQNVGETLASASAAAPADPNVADPNAVPAPVQSPNWKGIFVPGPLGPKLYVSASPISCDSNQLKPGQEVYRINFASNPNAPENYPWIENFHALTVNGATIGSTVYDQQCAQASSHLNFDIVQVLKADAQTLSGRLFIGSYVYHLVANFEAVSCPGADPFAVGPDVNTHCALPESCDPIAASCVQ